MKIRLKNGKNFRSFEGLRTAEGRQIRGDLFIRGAELSELTEEDIGKLKAFNPKDIIDLRIDDEIQEQPDKIIPDANNIKIPFFNDGRAGISKSQRALIKETILHSKNSGEILSMIPGMCDIYASSITDEYSQKAQGEILNLCLDNAISGRTTIYHCTIGKDRTGIISMLLETLIGVSYEDIIKDYRKSKKSTIRMGNKYYMQIVLIKRWRKVASKLRACFDAREEFLVAVYEEILRQYESVEDYIIRGLGISQEKIELFRSKVII